MGSRGATAESRAGPGPTTPDHVPACATRRPNTTVPSLIEGTMQTFEPWR